MSEGLETVKTGFILLAVTLLSKAAAFFITIIFSYYFGTDAVTDAYYAAGTIPNLVNTSLSICALTLFIPVYAKCRSESGPAAANEFTSNILNSFVFFNTCLFLIVCIVSPILAKLVAPGFNSEGLFHTRRMICLLSMSFPFTIATYVLNYLYNGNHKFVLPTMLTLVNHLIIIGGTITIASRFGIYAYPFICIGAWILQFAILFFCSNRRLFDYRFLINPKDKYVRYMIIQSVPVMLATAADQINLAADNIISSDLPTGSLSCIGYAHKIFNSIDGLVIATLLTMYYPIISKYYAEKNTKEVDKSVRIYLDMMLLLTLPLMGLLIINGKDIMDILFHRGAMDSGSIMKISLLFIIYIAGLLFIAVKEFATRLFYITGNTTIPTKVNIFCVAMNICLSLLLKQKIGIYGIALATTIATGLCAGIECASLIKRAGGKTALRNHDVINMKNLREIVLATAAAAVGSVLVKFSLPKANQISIVAICGCFYCIVFFLIMVLTRNEYVMKLKRYFSKAA